MPHSYGKRHGTRYMFSRGFRQHGLNPLKRFLETYKVGDFVDIKTDGSVQKGMPFKFYHGRTGRVWNVTRRAVGVEINKQVRNRIIKKRIHVRIEHVRKSKSRQEFLDRVAANTEIAKSNKARKAAGQPLLKPIKRIPAQPRKGGFVKVATEPEELHAQPYKLIM